VDLRADQRRLRLRRVYGIAEGLHLVGEEARCFPEAARVVAAAGAVEVADRNVDVEPVSRACERDVEQPPLLVEARAVGEAMSEGRLPSEAWIR
jgi:hypothetical protein